MSSIDLRGLRALVAVADARSFRAAAAGLGYTQSAVSHQVADLEAALGAALFTRPGGRGQVSLTPAGESAYRHARRTLVEVHALQASVQAHGGERTVLRVGVFQTAAAELLPTALQLLREEFPGIEVILTQTDDDPRMVEWLAEGRLDLALTINQQPDDRIELVRLFEDPWVLLTRRDSPLADAPAPSFDLLDGADVVAWTSRWDVQNEVEEAWRRRGIAPRVVYRTDDNLAMQRLVAAGLGHACIGRLSARRAIDPALTWLEPPDILTPRTVALCHPRRRHLAEAALALSSALRAQFGR
ncbi:MAG TPA: LysR family transcriptional regulator [Solirubrobacteraceae bacterium]|nr:LysR family transcriptional regulator [Solirubrobacteraceae bacterium]